MGNFSSFRGLLQEPCLWKFSSMEFLALSPPCGEGRSTHNDLILKIDSAKLSGNRLTSNYILSKNMQVNHIHLCAESLYSNYDSSKNLFKSFVLNLR